MSKKMRVGRETYVSVEQYEKFPELNTLTEEMVRQRFIDMYGVEPDVTFWQYAEAVHHTEPEEWTQPAMWVYYAEAPIEVPD